MCNDADIRYIRQDELQKLLDLYKHLHQDDPELHVENIKSLWDQIYHDKNMHYRRERWSIGCILRFGDRSQLDEKRSSLRVDRKRGDSSSMNTLPFTILPTPHVMYTMGRLSFLQ